MKQEIVETIHIRRDGDDLNAFDPEPESETEDELDLELIREYEELDDADV